MVSHSLHGAVKMSPHLTDSFIWGVYLRMSSENLSSFQDLLLLHRGFFYERPTRERKRAREREKDRERRDRERGRERERERKRKHKKGTISIIWDLHIFLSIGDYMERERESKRERDRTREKETARESKRSKMVTTQKWYYFHNMWSAYFPINRR